MDSKDFKETIGNLKISQDVISTIATVTTLEVDGIDSMASSPVDIKGIFKKVPSFKPVKIEISDDVAIIDIYANFKYGAKIKPVSENVQVSVKQAVQTMTGIAVSKINVHAVNIAFEDK